jgi:N-dimethylarginine dimethylaminohydrolase
VPLAEILFRARYRVIRGRSSRHDIAFIREPARWLESASLSLRRSLSVWI